MEAGEEFVASVAEAGTAVTLKKLIAAYLQDYDVREFRSENTARGRVAHLRQFFKEECQPQDITPQRIRDYQVARRKEGAATATINRETSALSRMCRIGVERGWLTSVPTFPGRLRENPPRQGFFEHPEYLVVRKHLPAPYQDVLDFAYYSGWRKHEILNLTWDEIDRDGGVIRLSPHRSKTQLGRVLPISQVLGEVLDRRAPRRRKGNPLVFHRDHVTVRAWRRGLARCLQGCQVPKRLLHDCRRTAARNLIRAGVPERIAMTLTGHKTRAVFDRYNIVNERELLTASDLLVAYLSRRPSRTSRAK